ncbi:hypothetical protein U9M48_017392, partial [Paspalum notatum var. saurae]
RTPSRGRHAVDEERERITSPSPKRKSPQGHGTALLSPSSCCCSNPPPSREFVDPVSRIGASTRTVGPRSRVLLELGTGLRLEGADFSRCWSGLRRGCGYRLGGAGSGWVPATDRVLSTRALLRALEVTVPALGATGRRRTED